MCLIIMREKGVTLSRPDFLTAVDNNPDGWGLSVPDGEGYLHTTRGVPEEGTDAEALYDLLHTEYKDDQFMLHLRYNTVGDTSLRNAHPFPVLERGKHGVDIRMAHNGTLSDYRPSSTAKNSWESDTRVFTRLFVRPLMERMVMAFGNEVLDDTFTHDVLHHQLTASSVLTFIDGSANVMYVNEMGNGGFFDEDRTYFSNKYSFTADHRKPASRSSGGSHVNSGNAPQDKGQHYGGGYYDTGYFNLDGSWTTYDEEDDRSSDTGWMFEGTKGADGNNVGKSQPRPEEKKGPGMADTRTDKFSDVFSKDFGIEGMEDMFSVSDDTIEAMLKLENNAAELFIKELLSHAYSQYQTLASVNRANQTLEQQKTKLEGLVHDAHQRVASQTVWIKSAKEQGYDGKAA